MVDESILSQNDPNGGEQLALGKKLIERGLVSPEQLMEALSERARLAASGGDSISGVGTILMERGAITRAQLDELKGSEESKLFESTGMELKSEILPSGATDDAPAVPAVPPPAPAETADAKPAEVSVELQWEDVPADSMPDAAHVSTDPGEAKEPPAEASIEVPPPSDEPPPEGDTSDSEIKLTKLGKYEISNELGRGGMGIVYEAMDSQLGRKVALKLMLDSPQSTDEERKQEEERFTREAQLSAKLKHPNIVSVYEAGILDNRRYLAMELVIGDSFSVWRNKPDVPLRRQIEVVRDVVNAVHHAHEQGILHRDLSPRNILIGSKNDQAYVTDFGLAKTLTKNVHASLTQSGAVVGTPAYMSPEQAQGSSKIDWRTDVYSLGVVLYEALTGRTPFSGQSPIEILMKVVKDNVVPPLRAAPRDRVVALDKTIDTICMKALAKEPRDRYVTAKAFADDLTKWLEGQDVKVTSPLIKIRQRKAARMALLTVALVALVGGAGFYVYMTNLPSAVQDLQLARSFEQKGDTFMAFHHYTLALNKEPDNDEARAGQARNRAAMGEQTTQSITVSQEKVQEARQKKDDLMAKAETASGDELEKIKAEIKEQDRIEAENLKKIEEQKTKQEIFGLQPKDPESPGDAKDTVVDLLSMVIPARDAIQGLWMRRGKTLHSDTDPNAQVRIPYVLPEEYDLEVTFRRTEGSGAINFLLPVKERAFALQLGGWGNTVSGFELVDGAPVKLNKTAVASNCAFLNDVDYTVTLRMRAGSVEALLDDKVLSRLETDFSNVELSPRWVALEPGIMGLATHESPTIFRDIKITVITGKGHRAPPVQASPLPPLKIRRSSLKPGLLARYYFGTSFDKLAVRKVDIGPDHRWSERSPWPEGPTDAFSCRWEGYFEAPRTGVYRFYGTADDGVRLQIGPRQVLVSRKRGTQGVDEGECFLSAGMHEIVVEYMESVKNASISLSWSPAGEEAIPSPLTRHLFHDPKKAVAFTFKPESTILPGHENEVSALAFRPGAQTLVSAGQDRKIHIWDTGSKRILETLGEHTQWIMALAFSRDGGLMASSGYDKTILLRNAETKEIRHTIKGHADLVMTLDFSADGRTLASGSYDGKVILWDVATGEQGAMMDHPGGVTAVVFSPDGKHLATGCTDRIVRIWSAADGKEVRRLEGHADGVETVVYSPDGKTLASGGSDYQVRVWNASSGELVRTLIGHRKQVSTLAFSPDGKLLASGSADTTIRLWKMPDGSLADLLPGHGGAVTCVVFSAEGDRLASASFDATVRFWSVDR